MNKWLQGTIAIAVLIVAGSTALLCLELCRVVKDIDNSITTDLNKITSEITKPCQGPAGPEACGTLQTINKTVIKAGDAIVTTQIQERTAAPHIIAAMDTLNDSSSKLGGSAEALTETAGALTDTANTATKTLASLQPAVDAFTTSGQDLDALLKRQAIQNFVDNMGLLSENLVSMTGSGKSILTDGAAQVHTWTHPTKKRLTFWTAIEAGGDYAQHFMPSIF